jgi:hypothetical protein
MGVLHILNLYATSEAQYVALLARKLTTFMVTSETFARWTNCSGFIFRALRIHSDIQLCGVRW